MLLPQRFLFPALAFVAAALAAPMVWVVDRASSTTVPEHRVIIQVTQNDQVLMNTALNNAQNLTKHYAGKGERVQIEFVAYGPGLHMLRSDTSPVRERLAAVARTSPQITFSGCGNTMAAQSSQEAKQISLVSEARVVPTGIARILELQEQGWTYVRP
jgi:intracellular sulfur oxidation DsrE/DsrF family protein